MANTISVLMTNILAGALDTLREEATIAKMVTKDFRGVSGRKGQTVSVSVPVAQTVGNVTPAATAPAFTDTVVTEKTFTLNNWKRTGFHLKEDEARQISNDATFIPPQINEAVRAMVFSINADLFSKYKKVNAFAGTAGTNPFTTNINPVADVRQSLNVNLCPEGNRKLVLNYAAETAALKLTSINQYLNRGDTGALDKGQVGYLFGFDVYRDSQVPTHTSTPLTAGACTVNGVNAAGATTISIAKATNTSPLVAGDLITIGSGPAAGTYAVNADVTLAVGNTNVTLSTGLLGATAGGETITLTATHTVNLAFDPAAFALAMRLPEWDIEGMPTYGTHMSMTDPVSGIPLKLSYFPGYHGNQWELSALWGCEIIDTRRAARLLG